MSVDVALNHQRLSIPAVDSRMVDIGLEYFGDQQGSFIVGWLAPSVLYAEFDRTISAELGASFTRRFKSLMGDAPGVRYFADSGGVVSYDVIAMAAVFGALLEKRRQFQVITARPWQGAIGPKAIEFAKAFGCFQYVESAADFYGRLKRATPAGFLELRSFSAALRIGEDAAGGKTRDDADGGAGSALTPRSVRAVRFDRRR